MENRAILVTILMAAWGMSFGQNLVRNCDFSLFTTCPSSHSQFDRAKYWRTPGEGTSDLCHTCSGGVVGIPGNQWGNEPVYSGEGYAHIICYYPFQGNDYREYIQAELACELDAGATYNVYFYASCTESSRWAIDGLGLLFTDEPINQSGDNVIDPGSPGHIFNPPGTVITQQAGWWQVAGQYTAAGGERYITIGNFIPEDELTISPFPGSSTFYTSFYIDMVSVKPAVPWDILGADTTVCFGEPVLLEAQHPCGGTLTWDDGSHEAQRLVTAPGTYSLSMEIGCSTLWDHLTVTWREAPGITLPPDTVVCHGGSLVLDPGAFAAYAWQDGSTQPTYTVTEPGSYSVALTDDLDCTYRDTVNIAWLESPELELGEDVVLCLGDSLLLDAGNENQYTAYLWHDNSAGRYFLVTGEGDCSVLVTNPCGSASDALFVAYRNCEPVVTVPNAFSPNGDGRNDTFRPYCSNISDYRLQVFDRWGALIYETSDSGSGWDGTRSGSPCPGEVYVWLIRYQNDQNESQAVKGSVLLIR